MRASACPRRATRTRSITDISRKSGRPHIGMSGRVSRPSHRQMSEIASTAPAGLQRHWRAAAQRPRPRPPDPQERVTHPRRRTHLSPRPRQRRPSQTIGSVRTQSARSPQYVHKGPIAAIDCRRYNCRSEALLPESAQVREPPKWNPAYRPTHPPTCL
jgi:hypothetical protein